LLNWFYCMPTIVRASPEEIAQRAQSQNRIVRVFAWSAVFVASRFPEIICRELGFQGSVLVSPILETLFLIGLAMAAAKLCSNKHLAGFILATAALTFSWRIVVPWIESSSVFVSTWRELSWGARFFALRATRTTGALFLIFTLLGSGIGRRELFLRLGDWRAPVQPEPFFRFRRPISWMRFSLTLLLLFGVLLPPYLFWTFDFRNDHVHLLLVALPWALATSALNAASEEFQFRSVPLARLTNVVSSREAFLLAATLFGVGHYFGQPSGWGGVFLAGFAGWIWAKSMVETRGFVCAFAMHFVQDLVVFCFLAMSATDLSSAWS
jgi:membrane protease YdiL (CAAX protease family)